MKYRDLPNEKLLNKILATSFKSPKTNLDVYNWCNSVLPAVRFVENERIKLIQKYGDKNADNGNISVPNEKIAAFMNEFNSVLDMEVEIPTFDFTAEMFDDEKCCFSIEKTLWLTPQEIGFLINIFQH